MWKSYREQFREEIGADLFDSLPDAPAYRPRPRPGRRDRPAKPRIEHRRRLVMSGYLPPLLGAGFTTGELAVLAVLAVEVRRAGRCDLTVGAIGEAAKVGKTTVRNALAWASRWGLISIERRKLARDYNAPNLIRIVSAVWLAWLRLGPSRPRPWAGGGFKTATGGGPATTKQEVAAKRWGARPAHSGKNGQRFGFRGPEGVR